jgi:hypothetical protein
MSQKSFHLLINPFSVSHNIPIGKNYKDLLLKIVNDRLIGK